MTTARRSQDAQLIGYDGCVFTSLFAFGVSLWGAGRMTVCMCFCLS